MFKFYKKLAILSLSLCIVMPVFAQSDTPQPSPTAEIVTAVPTAEATEAPPAEPPTPALPPTTETPSDILGIVLATLFAGSATIAGSVFVTAVVGVLKMVIPASVASGDMLKNIVSVVVWIGYSLAIKFGLGTEFQGLATFLAPILVTAAPLIGVLIGSSKLYLAAKSANVPIVGYARSPNIPPPTQPPIVRS